MLCLCFKLYNKVICIKIENSRKFKNQSELSRQIGWAFFYLHFSQSATFWKKDSSTLELWIYWKCMNNLKIEIHKKLLKEGSEKFQWAEDFTNIRIDEICFQEKLPIEEIICVLCFLVSFLAVK